MTDLLPTALAYQAAGFSVVPITADGEKRPALKTWAPFDTTPAGAEQIRRWFTGNATDGLGSFCGAVSGNLEMFELEGRALTEGLLDQLAQALADHGLADLWVRLNAGHLEITPSHGLHWLYRVEGEARPNLKLARRPATPDELAANPKDKIKVLIETRGEGGFTVLAPSAGRSHPSGQPWTLLAGGPDSVPVITEDERDALHAVATLFDQMPAAEDERSPTRTRTEGDPLRPGDDFNARATWDDVLVPHGWTKVRPLGRGHLWRRPGKNRGVSATTAQSSDGADRLYVFSSSTEFETAKPYTKFAAHALLEHGGDYGAAAKSLRGQGFGAPPEQPRDITDLIADPKADTAAPATNPGPATYTLTDDGNALRLVDSHGQHVRYVPERGTWLAWDGHRWRWDTAGNVRELARRVARALPAGDKQNDRHRAASLSSRGLSAMVRIAETDSRVVVPIDQLDNRPYELNTPAGVVDLRTGQLRAPDPAALHTRSTVVAPEFGVEPPRWLKFLADTFAGDPALTVYVQRLLGISLIGQVLEQVLPFAYGEGANGKTTLLGVVQRLVGLGDDGYAISAPAELLLATNNQGHPTEIARLAGARVVVTSELDEGQRFAEAKVKVLTGRDAIAGRFMRQDWFSFTPTHTLWLLANHQPAVRAGGPAFWRRLRLVPFLHTVPSEQRDPHLEDTLVHDEGPAILAWLVQGAADYLTEGLPEPDAVRVATEGYQRDQDTVARFVDEACQIGEPTDMHMQTKVAAVRSAYETWCRTEGEHAVSQKAFTLALRSRYGVMSERNMHARMYSGIALLDLSSDPSSKDAGSDDSWWSR